MSAEKTRPAVGGGDKPRPHVSEKLAKKLGHDPEKLDVANAMIERAKQKQPGGD